MSEKKTRDNCCSNEVYGILMYTQSLAGKKLDPNRVGSWDHQFLITFTINLVVEPTETMEPLLFEKMFFILNFGG